MPSTRFELEGSSSGRWSYVQVWYSVFQQVQHVFYMLKHTIPYLCI